MIEFLLHGIFNRIHIHGTFVCDVIEHVACLLSFHSSLFVSKDKINPMIYVSYVLALHRFSALFHKVESLLPMVVESRRSLSVRPVSYLFCVYVFECSSSSNLKMNVRTQLQTLRVQKKINTFLVKLGNQLLHIRRDLSTHCLMSLECR